MFLLIWSDFVEGHKRKGNPHPKKKKKKVVDTPTIICVVNFNE